MTDQSHFADLLARVRSGDEQAAAELVQTYEPNIRRVIRVRMTDPALRRYLDSEDVCNSVLGDFFYRTALGQFDIDSPEQLIKLLATMARNKYLRRIQELRRKRRDIRRNIHPGSGVFDPIALTSTASQVVQRKELVSECRRRMDEEERFLADQRAAGRAWGDIARELGVTPDNARVRLTRAIERVAAELGLESYDT
jgi:RNA polymerase sigma-70 factor (ECF subfamily)